MYLSGCMPKNEPHTIDAPNFDFMVVCGLGSTSNGSCDCQDVDYTSGEMVGTMLSNEENISIG
jgi:hypothetical protein